MKFVKIAKIGMKLLENAKFCLIWLNLTEIHSYVHTGTVRACAAYDFVLRVRSAHSVSRVRCVYSTYTYVRSLRCVGVDLRTYTEFNIRTGSVRACAAYNSLLRVRRALSFS